MMKFQLFLIFIYFFAFSSCSREGKLIPRWLFGFGNRPGISNYCGNPDNCPVHHCRFDDTVIHGFCCGCARVSDRVPIQCPPWLKCPPTPQPLCSEYDYLMDCCC